MFQYQHPQYFLFHNQAVRPQQITTKFIPHNVGAIYFTTVVLLLYFHAFQCFNLFQDDPYCQKSIKTNLPQLLIPDNTNWNSGNMFYGCCKCFSWRVTKGKLIQISFYSFLLLSDFKLGVTGQLIKDHWNWELQRVAIMDCFFVVHLFVFKLLESLYIPVWI